MWRCVMADSANIVITVLLIAVVLGLSWAADRAAAKEHDRGLAVALLVVALCFDGMGLFMRTTSL
ncbi:MAG TPA: hypothetical protein VHD38_00495 [Candidatus Paceibacterota bacterium]|nr:hypothetical protein [Candidatus Paceibacterota bacterium]